MANFLHQADLPDYVDLGPVIAIDTETMGLNLSRDRLCLVQVSDGKGDAHLVQMPQRDRAGTAPRRSAASGSAASASRWRRTCVGSWAIPPGSSSCTSRALISPASSPTSAC